MSAIPQWLAKWGISQPAGSWDAHIARGSLGGVDFPAPAGTNMLAASDGRLIYFKLSDGSSVLRVIRADGTATDLLHGRLVGSAPRNVKLNDHIGESDGRPGTDGAGRSTGAHIHAHDIKDGTRVYPWSTVPGGGSGGGGIQEEDDMFRTWYLSLTPAGNWGAFWYTPTFGAIPLTTVELEAIKRENALTTGGVQQYTDAVALSNLVRRAAAWLVEQIDKAVDDEAILAAVKAVDVNPEFQIDATLLASELAKPGSALLAAIDAADDDEHARLEAAIASIRPGDTAADFVAALKAAL